MGVVGWPSVQYSRNPEREREGAASNGRSFSLWGQVRQHDAPPPARPPGRAFKTNHFPTVGPLVVDQCHVPSGSTAMVPLLHRNAQEVVRAASRAVNAATANSRSLLRSARFASVVIGLSG